MLKDEFDILMRCTKSMFNVNGELMILQTIQECFQPKVENAKQKIERFVSFLLMDVFCIDTTDLNAMYCLVPVVYPI